MKVIDDIRRDNLRIIEREQGGSPTKAANAVGMTLVQFSNLRDGAKDSKTGKPRGMRPDTARRIENRAGKPRGWLDVSHDEESSKVTPGPDAHGPYPLISYVQAGGWTELCDSLNPGEAQEWLMSTRSLGPHGYMLRVKGKSMEDPNGQFNFKEGMVLHVNPDLEPLPGQFVIVRRGNETVFKRYLIDGGKKYLEAINPDWPKEDKFLKIQPGDVWCGVVVDASIGKMP